MCIQEIFSTKSLTYWYQWYYGLYLCLNRKYFGACPSLFVSDMKRHKWYVGMTSPSFSATVTKITTDVRLVDRIIVSKIPTKWGATAGLHLLYPQSKWIGVFFFRPDPFLVKADWCFDFEHSLADHYWIIIFFASLSVLCINLFPLE